MKYTHLSRDERYLIGAMRSLRLSRAEIARALDRSPSTISRELRRNVYKTNGRYAAYHAHRAANGRRRRTRRHSHFKRRDWRVIEKLLRDDLSPEQVVGTLRLRRRLSISHETIYRHIWLDKRRGGSLHRHLRGRQKMKRKRYGAYDSRGRLAGKRMIEKRPKVVEQRTRIGDWEIDTVLGSTKACIVTLVERKTGYLQIGHLKARTVKETNARIEKLIGRSPESFITITSDNGTEFHGYRDIEKSTAARFYFANPYHSWERGTNENTNGLIRQYLPKRTSMDGLTQARCNAIADKLNARPRKRLGFRTPKEVFLANS